MSSRKLIPTIFDDFMVDLFDGRRQSGMELSVYEDDMNFFVEAPVPGLSPNEVNVKLEKGGLWIKGECKQTEQDKSIRYHRMSKKSFFYHVPLPDGLNLDKTPKATHKYGIITVQFEKVGGHQSKFIPIESQDDSAEKTL